MITLNQFSKNASFEKPREKETYSSPTVVLLGSVSELTLGDGSTDKWDIGPGWVKA